MRSDTACFQRPSEAPEDDPEASQKALEWQMSFDASTADRLTTARSLTPCIQGGLSRERALRGTRILGCDAGLQRSMGIGRAIRAHSA